MRPLVQDIRYGVRMLGKTPALTAIVSLTLALGIGANALIFSLVNGFFLRPLPVPQAGQIAVLAATQKADMTLAYSFSYPEFDDFRKQARPFAELFGYTVGLRGLGNGNRADQVLAAFVTGNYFSALGIQPALGRFILASEEDQPGLQPAVVLGYACWQKRFGGDPSVVGRQVRVNGQAATVVGVVPATFSGTQWLIDPEMYLPLSGRAISGKSLNGALTDRGERLITVLGRLKPGIGLSQAQASTDVIAARLAKQYPATDANITVRVYPERLARPFPTRNNVLPIIAGLLMILAALLLLVACMNVTNVLLARAAVRRREMGLRAALGASRGRLIRQMLTETLLLAMLGGALGTLLGAWANPGDISRLGPAGFPAHLDFAFDWHVFAYAFAIALLAGVIAGLWPAWGVSRNGLSSVLQEGARSSTEGRVRHGFRSALVVAQVAGSLTLLIVAGLFVRSLRHAETMYLGFDPDHLFNITLDPNSVGFDEARTNEFYRQLKARVLQLPGVQSASLAYAVPMGGLNAAYAASITIEGQPLGRGQQPPLLFFNNVDERYFDTTRVPLIQGRAFTEADNAGAPAVAIVNQRMADRFWPHQDALGKRFQFKGPNGSAKTVEIVGIAGNGRYVFIGEDPIPYFYVPFAQNYTALRVLQVRSTVPPETLLEPVQQEVHQLAPDLPILSANTMRESLGGYLGLWFFRAGARLATAAGALGLILAIVGLYGLVSFAVAQRTREIGIRMALGGSERDVMRLILEQGFRMVAFGLAIGVVVALGMTRVMTRLLIGVSASDPLTYAIVALLLSAVALLACWIPARRATRVDPGVALRYE